MGSIINPVSDHGEAVIAMERDNVLCLPSALRYRCETGRWISAVLVMKLNEVSVRGPDWESRVRPARLHHHPLTNA